MKSRRSLLLSLFICAASSISLMYAERESKKLLECIKGKVCKIEQKVCDLQIDGVVSSECDTKIKITQDENRVITTPGTYQLCEDIEVADDDIGIEVLTSDVIIDMNNHTIFGNNGANQIGILLDDDFDNLQVFNGTIRDLGQTERGAGGNGIDIMGGSGHKISNVCVQDMQGTLSIALEERLGNGIILNNAGSSIVKNCNASDNTSYGIFMLTTSGSCLRECMANNNVGNGLRLEDCNDCCMIECGAIASGGSTDAFPFLAFSDINADTGISIDSSANCLISDCFANNNVNAGISFTKSTGCAVLNCTTQKNGSKGTYISESLGTAVTNCTANENDDFGILLDGSPACAVSDCTTVRNGIEGVRLQNGCSRCSITGCRSDGNDNGLCIVESPACVVDQCAITSNESGIILELSPFCSVKNSLGIGTSKVIAVNFSDYCTINGCDVTLQGVTVSSGSQHSGISILGSSNCIVTECVATGTDALFEDGMLLSLPTRGIRIEGEIFGGSKTFNCTVQHNRVQGFDVGILVSAQSPTRDNLICDNVCSHNINAGIELTDTATHTSVLRNKCVLNGIGIKDDGFDTTVAYNICTNNDTDYDNVSQPIVPLFTADTRVGVNVET